MATWQTNTLRLTAFPSPSANFSSEQWWSKTLDTPPENISSKPQIGEQTYESSYYGGKLVLNVNPFRIDWLLGNAEDPTRGNAGVKFLVLGSFTETLPIFHKLMSQWLSNDSVPAVSRLAFGVSLLWPVESYKQGYETLTNYLSNVKLDADNLSDFIYQVNKPRKTTTGANNLIINRLSKWSLLRVQSAIRSVVLPRPVHQFPDLYACNLELDINTSPEYSGEFTHQQLSAIFDELIQFGKEIVELGDIP